MLECMPLMSIVKNIVLTGFGDITLLDLDTIDLSNLNRQFLFRKKDIKQSKAMVRSHLCYYTAVLQSLNPPSVVLPCAPGCG